MTVLLAVKSKNCFAIYADTARVRYVLSGTPTVISKASLPRVNRFAHVRRSVTSFVYLKPSVICS